jgi:Tfp pilus assembly protein PilE
MERCFTQYNSYTDSHCPSFPAASPQGFYTITASASATTSTTFELAAVPAATSSQKDDHQCQKFTLDNTGQRTAKNQSGADTTAECW